uniref:Uncharacterized protein n=1 Tax=Avena sativa TaxID=4498 RepID=A0ACD5ZQN1_AVESA
MSMFTGVSVVNDWHCTTSTVNANTDSGYHLFVVKDYSVTVLAIPGGEEISSGYFMVGGINWKIMYYPNGSHDSCADFISFYISPGDEYEELEETLELKFQFSFADQVEYHKPMHIRAAKTYKLPGILGGCREFMKRDAFERSTHLKGDCFTIRCDIMVCKDFNTHNTYGTLSEIHDHFDHLLRNKVGCDVTFEVSGETFNAHRCVLGARSKVFMAQLFGPMVEGTMSSVIHIEDMEARVFAALLRFIYTDSFPEMHKDNNIKEEGQKDEEGQEEHVMWLQELLVAADRYDLQRLKFLCENKLSDNIGVSSVASTLALAEQHHCQRLKEECFKFIQVQSPKCLDKVMATHGWEQMILTYPSILNKFLAKLVSSNQKKNKKRKTPLRIGSG